ncbi:carboxypeptidase-like regulatory domain-containing protein, partial [Anabaenopsis arnoldii]|nr:carboxypeptidase-like regulatory domain-containing protein [Anabaenopsis arnoldii]
SGDVTGFTISENTIAESVFPGVNSESSLLARSGDVTPVTKPENIPGNQVLTPNVNSEVGRSGDVTPVTKPENIPGNQVLTPNGNSEVGRSGDVPQVTKPQNIPSSQVLTPNGNSEVGRSGDVTPVTKPENIPGKDAPAPTSQELARREILGLTTPSNVSTPKDILPVGIKFGKQDVLSGVLVKGNEDGSEAVNFEEWLIPYESFLKAFGFTVTPLPNGNVQLRSPGLVKEFDPKLLIADSEIGEALTIAEIRRQFMVEIKFDIDSYAIVFEGSWLFAKGREEKEVRPVVLEGLPRVTPPEYALSAVSQNVNSSLRTNTFNNSGSTTIGGKLGEFTFSTRVAQPNLENFNQAYLQDWRIQNLGKNRDHIFGSQSLFYPGSSNFGEFWGYSYISRFGYEAGRGGSDANLNSRLSNRDFVRTVEGNAAQGSLVQIWGGNVLLGEVLVNETQRYSFPNVQGNRFTILSYPEGNLAATPEREIKVIDPQYDQLPAGTSAVYTSVGTWRQREQHQSLGSVSGLVTGAGYRYGISNDLTVGFGGVYDSVNFRSFGEVIYGHSKFPLTLGLRSLSATANQSSSLTFSGSFRLNPSSSIFWSIGEQVSWRLNSSFEPIKNVRLQTELSNTGFNVRSFHNLSLLGVSANLSLGYEQKDNSLRTFAETSTRWRWGNLSHNLDGRFEGDGGWRLRNSLQWKNWQLDLTNSYKQVVFSRFNAQESEIWNNLSFPIIGSNSYQEIYLVNNLNRHKDNSIKDQIYGRYLKSDNASLAVAAWRHNGNPTSGREQLDRTNWSWELGYGFGSQSSGPVVSVTSPSLFAGLSLKAGYSGASAQGVSSGFSLGLVMNLNLNLQDGISTDKRNASQFQGNGAILVQPFYDENNNGVRERNEPLITSSDNSLFMLNNLSLKQNKSLSLIGNGTVIPTPIGEHRLDLDPAGYPIGWEPQERAFAVEVAPGAYTIVKVPFVKTATVEGRLRNQLGQPVNGARVEAISTSNQKKYFSITSPSGAFYLDNLPLGEYTLNVGGLDITPRTLQLNKSEFVQNTLELQVFIPRDGQTADRAAVPTYTVSGYLKDKAAENLKGIKVTAVHSESGKIFTSITDIQGFFKFQDLIQGEYQIKMGDFVVEPGKFIIDSSSPWENNMTLQVNAFKQEIYADAANYVVRGVLTDDGGARLSQVEVILTEVETNQKSLSETNALGAFIVENLPIGKYKIEIKKGAEELEASPKYLEINEESFLQSTVNIEVNLK